MSTTTIEGVLVDQALLDECRRIGDRLDSRMPELRELLATASAAAVKVEVCVMDQRHDLDDDTRERFEDASGVRRLYTILFELHKTCDFDAAILTDPAYRAAAHPRA